MIVLPGDVVQNNEKLTESQPVSFSLREKEGLYSLLTADGSSPSVPGTILVSDDISHLRVADIGQELDQVRVLVKRGAVDGQDAQGMAPCFEVRGYVRSDEGWSPDEVMVVPLREQLFSRLRGILETDVLADQRVFIVGQGSGGQPIDVGLVQSGIMHLDLMDPDRLELGNIMRSVLGLPDLGRYKTIAMADYLLRNKNPHLEIRTWEEKAGEDNVDLLRQRIRESDLVIGATDNRPSKRILNKLCVQEHKVLILAGAFRRAHGGIVQRIRPQESACYQCLLQRFPGQADDQEISSAEQAEGLAYTDRRVPIEPGLATDITAISLLVVKIAIQELLRGKSTTLKSLDEDLTAPLYLWLNRREAGTEYEKLEPLGYHIGGGMHVLQWYGAQLPPHPGCEHCGDFTGELAREHGITVTAEDVKAFAGDEEDMAT